jgi:uncharacterized protein (DUF58 family)
MGFTEVLTLIFITLKLTGYIDWGWFYVLLPEIIALSIILLVLIGYFIIILSGGKIRVTRKKK